MTLNITSNISGKEKIGGIIKVKQVMITIFPRWSLKNQKCRILELEVRLFDILLKTRDSCHENYTISFSDKLYSRKWIICMFVGVFLTISFEHLMDKLSCEKNKAYKLNVFYSGPVNEQGSFILTVHISLSNVLKNYPHDQNLHK